MAATRRCGLGADEKTMTIPDTIALEASVNSCKDASTKNGETTTQATSSPVANKSNDKIDSAHSEQDGEGGHDIDDHDHGDANADAGDQQRRLPWQKEEKNKESRQQQRQPKRPEEKTELIGHNLFIFQAMAHGQAPSRQCAHMLKPGTTSEIGAHDTQSAAYSCHWGTGDRVQRSLISLRGY